MLFPSLLLGALLAQIPQLGLQRHAVDLVDGQGEERADASGNLEVHVGEGLELTRTIPDNAAGSAKPQWAVMG